MQNVLLYVIIALGLSIVINLLLKRVGLSQIIGYILTGTIFTYALNLHYLKDSHELEAVGDFGIVLLMFAIGLEIPLARMNSMKNEIFGNGLLQVVLTSSVVYLLSHYVFALNITSSIIVALAFSLSSTAVVLSYLKSSKDIYTPYGQKATGILIFQDIAVIPILILISFLTNSSGQELTTVLTQTLLSVALVVAVLFIIGKPLITWLLHFSASSDLEELFVSSVLFIVISASFLASYMGFTYSLGAFIAGMIIAETKYHHKVESDIAPFKDILMGLFFVVVGMKIDVGMFLNNAVLIVGVFLLVLILKSIVTFAVVRFSASSAVSLKSALSLSQVGEFSFVIFAMATSGKLISEELSSLLVLIVIFSMVVTPFFIAKISPFVDKFIKDKEVATDMSALASRENHVIVCGYSYVGKFVTRHLDELDASYVVVDNSNKHVKEALNDNVEAYLGDASKASILEALHVEKASSVIITLDNIEKKRLICEAILKHSKNVNLVVKVTSKEEKIKLQDLHINVIVDGKIEVARILVERMLTCQLKWGR